MEKIFACLQKIIITAYLIIMPNEQFNSRMRDVVETTPFFPRLYWITLFVPKLPHRKPIYS